MNDCLRVAEKDYIARWMINAKQHFTDGDYGWICDLINKNPMDYSFQRVLEIGCGAGYSTLAFALKGFDVLSIDVNKEAIKQTKCLVENCACNPKVLDSQSYISDEEGILLWEVDLIHEFSKIRNFVSQQRDNPIDLIVLCNPGGQLTTELTVQEYKYLRWGGFADDEISEVYQAGNVGLLQKWAMIYAACGLSQMTGIPILIIERGTREEVQRSLQQIQDDTGNQKISEAYRLISRAPKEGIQLSVSNEQGEQFWGMALYLPVV